MKLPRLKYGAAMSKMKLSVLITKIFIDLYFSEEVTAEFVKKILERRCNELNFCGAYSVVPRGDSSKKLLHYHLFDIFFELEEDAVLFKTAYQEPK
jgi:hypothetical protein